MSLEACFDRRFKMVKKSRLVGAHFDQDDNYEHQKSFIIENEPMATVCYKLALTED